MKYIIVLCMLFVSFAQAMVIDKNEVNNILMNQFSNEKMYTLHAIEWIEEGKPYMIVKHIDHAAFVFYMLKEKDNGEYEFYAGDKNPGYSAFYFYISKFINMVALSASDSYITSLDSYFSENNDYNQCIKSHEGATSYIECSEIYRKIFLRAIFEIKSRR